MAIDLDGRGVMIVEWTLFALAYFMVALRIGVRLARRQQKQILVSDIFLVISALNCLGLIICDTWTYALGAMSTSQPRMSSKEEVILAKVSFASNYFYDTGIYLPKATLLALYFKLIPVTMPSSRKKLYIVTAYTLACALSTCFLDTFWCHNVPDNWSLKKGACSAFDSLLLFQIDWVLNVTSDLLIFALPFPLLRHLQLGHKELWALRITFALGLVTIGVSTGRFISVEVGAGWNGLYVWSMAEMAAAIVVVSLPALKSLLVRRSWSIGSLSRLHSTGQSGSNASHSANRKDTFGTNSSRADTVLDGTGSEHELSRFHKTGVIYRTEEISVESEATEMDEGSTPTQPWTNNRYQSQPDRVGSRRNTRDGHV